MREENNKILLHKNNTYKTVNTLTLTKSKLGMGEMTSGGCLWIPAVARWQRGEPAYPIRTVVPPWTHCFLRRTFWIDGWEETQEKPKNRDLEKERARVRVEREVNDGENGRQPSPLFIGDWSLPISSCLPIKIIFKMQTVSDFRNSSGYGFEIKYPIK